MCRFRFPQPPSSTTLISKPNDDDSVTNDACKTLAKVRKLLVNGKTDVSLSELLTLANSEEYEEHYHYVHGTIVANESKYSEADVDNIDIDKNGPPEHLWGNIAPNTENNRSHSLQEGGESITEITKEIYMTMLIFSIKEYLVVLYCCNLKELLISKRYLLMNIDSLYEVSILNNKLLLCTFYKITFCAKCVVF